MTSPIAGVASNPATVPVDPKLGSKTAADASKLSSDQFLQLLVAQLKYQDPSKPVDTAAFMQETATLSQVQGMEAQKNATADLLSAQRAQTATTLIGRTVKYTALDGTDATGVVTSALISGATPTVNIGGVNVDLTKITEVLSTTP